MYRKFDRSVYRVPTLLLTKNPGLSRTFQEAWEPCVYTDPFVSHEIKSVTTPSGHELCAQST